MKIKTYKPTKSDSGPKGRHKNPYYYLLSNTSTTQVITQTRALLISPIRAFITNPTEGGQIDSPILVRVKVILVIDDLKTLGISVPPGQRGPLTYLSRDPPADHAANTYQVIITLTESAAVPYQRSRQLVAIKSLITDLLCIAIDNS